MADQEEGIGISIRKLYKIFGSDPAAYVDLVKQGMTKTELNEKHNHVLGLKDINIEMPGGAIQVVMGLSGSGKSTLIRHINRLIDPTAGEVIVGDDDVVKMNEKELREFRRHKTAMVFQKFALLPHRTVMENTVYGLELQGVPRKKQEEEAQRWITRVGLEGFEDNYPNQLSGGMQQRVGIARALASNSDIMLMDEAFSALDPLIRTDMQDLLIELQAELHKTIVFITHDLDEALKLADHLVILKDGAVVQQGEPQKILLAPADPYIEDFVADINRARVLRARSVMTKGVPSGDDFAGDVDQNDNLESIIAHAEGAMDKRYRVTRDGKPVGTLEMKAIMKALVPRKVEG